MEIDKKLGPQEELSFDEIATYFRNKKRMKRITGRLKAINLDRSDPNSDMRLKNHEFLDKFGFETCLYLLVHRLNFDEDLTEDYSSIDLELGDQSFGSPRDKAACVLQEYLETKGGDITNQKRRLISLSTIAFLKSKFREANINTLNDAARLLPSTLQPNQLNTISKMAFEYSYSGLGDHLSNILLQYVWKTGMLYSYDGVLTPQRMMRGDFAGGFYRSSFVDKEKYLPGWRQIASEFCRYRSIPAIEVAVLNGLKRPEYADKLKKEGLFLAYPASGSDLGPLYLTMLLISSGLIERGLLHFTEIRGQPEIGKKIGRLGEKGLIDNLVTKTEQSVSGVESSWDFKYRGIPVTLVLDIQNGDSNWAGGRDPLPDRSSGKFNFIYLHDLHVHGAMIRSDPKAWAAAFSKEQVIGDEVIVLTQGDKQGFSSFHSGKKGYNIANVLEIGLEFGDEASAVLARVKYI